MKLDEIIEILGAECVTGGVNCDKDVDTAIACDLMSWVVGNGCPDCAFITIQTSINAVAVASLIEMACIIIVSNGAIDEKVVEKAIEEEIPVIRTNLSTFEVCGILYQNGVKAVNKNETVR